VQPETGHIQITHNAGGVQLRENVAKLRNVSGKYAARVVILIEASQSLVADGPDHSEP
jgi:hypothetical protein